MTAWTQALQCKTRTRSCLAKRWVNIKYVDDFNYLGISITIRTFKLGHTNKIKLIKSIKKRVVLNKLDTFYNVQLSNSSTHKLWYISIEASGHLIYAPNLLIYHNLCVEELDNYIYIYVCV